MRSEEVAAPPELRHVVHRIWRLRGAAPAATGPFQRVMPDGRAELIFNLAVPFECRDGEGSRPQPLARGTSPRLAVLRRHLARASSRAHLARDFRLFGGIPPARWLRETRELTRGFIADLD